MNHNRVGHAVLDAALRYRDRRAASPVINNHNAVDAILRYIRQNGFNNSADVDQSGAFNLASVEQRGTGNQADVTQNGVNGVVII
ncbi:MAG: hypothetical protein AAFW68_09350, partial [Pseudomonadota bacterium]